MAEHILSLIPFLVIALFFAIEKKPLLKYCYTIAPDFGYVTRDYQKGNLNNGLNQAAHATTPFRAFLSEHFLTNSELTLHYVCISSAFLWVYFFCEMRTLGEQGFRRH